MFQQTPVRIGGRGRHKIKIRGEARVSGIELFQLRNFPALAKSIEGYGKLGFDGSVRHISMIPPLHFREVAVDQLSDRRGTLLEFIAPLAALAAAVQKAGAQR
jgi:hypothetical protein